jgi:hypothetical protein
VGDADRRVCRDMACSLVEHPTMVESRCWLRRDGLARRGVSGSPHVPLSSVRLAALTVIVSTQVAV